MMASSPKSPQLKEELGGTDPSRAPKFLLEYLKTWHLMIVVIVFTVIVVLTAGVGQLAPAPYTIEFKQHNLSGPELDTLYRNNATIYHETDFLWGPNQDWFASFRLSATRNLDRSIGKDDLLVSVRIYYRESPTAAWADVVSDEISQAYSHRLSCPQMSKSCQGVFVAHEPNIRHNYYRIGITLLNAQTLYDEGYLGDIATSVMYTSTLYTLFELFWRLIFLLINFVVIVFFAVMVIYARTNLLQAAVEQKFVILMLLALLLFNNPLFIFDVFLNWVVVFPVLNQIFMSTFVAILFFYILVLLHATILRKPGRRSFLSFYLPKIVWIFCIWILNIGTQLWFRYEGMANPTQPLVDSSYSLTSLGARVSLVASIVLLIGYGFWVLYLLFRGFGKAARHRLSNIDSRFKFVWLLTFMTLAVTVGFAVFSVFAGGNNAVVFICYWTLFNLFVTFNAIVYAPTRGTYTPWEVQKNIQQAASPPPDLSNTTNTANVRMEDNYAVPHEDIDTAGMQQLRDDDEEIRFDDPKASEEMHEISITDDETRQQPQFGFGADNTTSRNQY